MFLFCSVGYCCLRWFGLVIVFVYVWDFDCCSLVLVARVVVLMLSF